MDVGPPGIVEAPSSMPRFPLEALLASDPGKALSEWASSSPRRLATAPMPPAIAPATPQGSVADLLMAYIRRQKQRNGLQTPVLNSGAPSALLDFSRGVAFPDTDSFSEKSAFPRLSSPLDALIRR
jgi:hypothetical protein